MTSPLRLSFLLLAFIPWLSYAEAVTMVREYTYNASENDSKVSARKAALQQLQVLLIEEVGVQIQSSFSNTETLDKEEFSRTVQANYQTFASALTKTRILEEKWDGEHFFIKAEIEVDPDGLSSQISAAVASNGKNPCDAVRDQVNETLKKAPSPDKNNALVAFAVKAPFDNDCHDWQYNVMYSLTQSRYPADGYRAYAFSQLPQTAAHNLADLIPTLLKFAIIKDNGLSNDEWNAVVGSLKQLPADRLPAVFSVLSNYSEKAPDDGRSGKPSYQLQSADTLKAQLLTVIAEAGENRIGEPAVTAGAAATMAIKSVAYRQPAIGSAIFHDYADQLPDLNDVAKMIIEFYKNQLPKTAADSEPYLALQDFLQRMNNQPQTLNATSAGYLYGLISVMDRNSEKDPQQAAALQSLLGGYPQIFASSIKAQRVNDVQKNLWFIRFGLPDSPACQPRTCAEALSGQGNAMEIAAYADYLVAYGSRASVAEDLIVRKFERVRAMNSSTYRTTLKQKLLDVLGNIHTADNKAHDMIIASLGDLDYEVPEHATAALVKLGPAVQQKMMTQIATYEPLVQRRIVTTLGQMPASADIVRFLQSIKPADQYMRFAVEDALQLQQRTL